MEALMLVSNAVVINNDLKECEIGKVINFISSETLPFVYEFNIFIKLYRMPTDQTIDCQVAIYNDDNEMYGFSNVAIVRNYKDFDISPGVDMALKVNCAVYKAGILQVKLFIDGEEHLSYPITVRIV
ncbi:hypothetical protein [Paenibacillus marinisediminis]